MIILLLALHAFFVKGELNPKDFRILRATLQNRKQSIFVYFPVLFYVLRKQKHFDIVRETESKFHGVYHQIISEN